MTNGAQPHRVRKTVTIVCCDLRDSTGMGERFDVESLGEVIARYREAMREVLERHGAKTDISGGDAVIGQFGEPTVHEDDALRAVRAALEMRETLADLNDDVRKTWGIHLAIKIGVNTGEVVAGDLAYHPRMVTADAANVAARLEHAAEGGEILIGEPTYRLVRDVVEVEALGPLTLRGKARPVTAFRLLAVSEPAPGIVRPLDSPLVGRERELARLLDAFELARADKIPGIVTVFGPPGIGKSRIAKELAARLEGRVWALRGRCLPYGDGITFWPIAEVVRSAARIREADSPVEATAKIATLMPTDPEAGDVAELLAEAIGVTDGSADRQGIFWAFKKLVSSLSSQRPLLLLLDDLHWGEPTFLELVQELAQDEDAGALLIVALARPELLAAFPGWPRGGGRALSIELEPLAPRESRRLLERQLGLVEDTVLERITKAARGNPLFLEETLRMLVDDGLLRQDGDAWRAAPAIEQLRVPPTIQALLGARLDRLEKEMRIVLERAAVVGEEFVPDGVLDLLPELTREALEQRLEALVERRLIEPGGTPFAGEEAFHFVHLLLRDVAYDEILKQDRAELHERQAEWLERKAGGRAGEYREIIGYHLERATAYRRDLRPPDAESVELARRAAAHLGEAGRRALTREDARAAVNLLERAIALLDEGDRELPDLQVKLGLALKEIGDVARADALFDDWIANTRKGRALLVFPDAKGRQQVFDLDACGSRISIGRESSNDLSLGWDGEVSRLHARLERTGDSWTVIDDGLSRNGSFVNGERVLGRRLLRGGDVVRLGATALAFHSGDSRPKPLVQTRATTATAASLRMMNLSRAERRVLGVLCRSLDTQAEAAALPSDEEIARELSISTEEVAEEIRSLHTAFDTENLPAGERRTRLAERALRSGLLSTILPGAM